MSALLLVLAAAAQTYAPPPAPPRAFVADGFEPFWHLEIDGNRVTFDPGDGSAGLRAVPVRRQRTPGGSRYVSPRIIVQIWREDCGSEDGDRSSHNVRIRVGTRTFNGCGGNLLPPLSLEYTGWRIIRIGDTRVWGRNYLMEFRGNGILAGQAGCNRISGTYALRGNRLLPGPVMATSMACPGERMAHERAVMQLFRGPLRISFPAGDILVLSGAGGTIRLQAR